MLLSADPHLIIECFLTHFVLSVSLNQALVEVAKYVFILSFLTLGVFVTLVLLDVTFCGLVESL